MLSLHVHHDYCSLTVDQVDFAGVVNDAMRCDGPLAGGGGASPSYVRCQLSLVKAATHTGGSQPGFPTSLSVWFAAFGVC